uniref:Fumarylacetoacetase-like C-terminal domain-containing protein n=1 Tax=Dromaius novaehollandiae TaxID=8790 RepID=A0A8C4J712_DRONO
AKLPAEPIIFSKFPSAIAGPFDDILHPAESSVRRGGREVELAFVIGRKGKHIAEEAALEHVAGFAVANDVSARDWQRRNGRQWLLSKTFDTFCPLGPALVTKDAVTDVNNLSIRCSVNGHPVQSSNTSQLIFKVPQLVAWVSRFVTLLPGDVFLTGTPPGVGLFRKPPVFLKVSWSTERPVGLARFSPLGQPRGRAGAQELPPPIAGDFPSSPQPRSTERLPP